MPGQRHRALTEHHREHVAQRPDGQPGERGGLTTVQGCGFGGDGAFYATEFQTDGLGAQNPAGDVVRISQNGDRTHLGVGKLSFPSGFAAGADGAIYVLNCSIAPATGMSPQVCPSGGQVVRLG